MSFFFHFIDEMTWGLWKLNGLLSHVQSWHLDPHLHTPIFIYSKMFIEGPLCANYGWYAKKTLLFRSSPSRTGHGKITISSRKCWALDGWCTHKWSALPVPKGAPFLSGQEDRHSAGLWGMCVCGVPLLREGRWQEQQGRTQECKVGRSAGLEAAMMTWR